MRKKLADDECKTVSSAFSLDDSLTYRKSVYLEDCMYISGRRASTRIFRYVYISRILWQSAYWEIDTDMRHTQTQSLHTQANFYDLYMLRDNTIWSTRLCECTKTIDTFLALIKSYLFCFVYSGGSQNLQRRNLHRSIFHNFKIANIKIRKDELFDSFIIDFFHFL